MFIAYGGFLDEFSDDKIISMSDEELDMLMDKYGERFSAFITNLHYKDQNALLDAYRYMKQHGELPHRAGTQKSGL